jgi:hypothetical protein
LCLAGYAHPNTRLTCLWLDWSTQTQDRKLGVGLTWLTQTQGNFAFDWLSPLKHKLDFVFG